jgi:antitoxin component YwqK of YwqJK toxin-antitoxin module
MKDGELHGDWQWWRRDGSLQRSGRFDRGRQVGTWTTYGRDGAVVKTTDLGS